MKAAVLKWLQGMRATNVPISGSLLCAQALKFPKNAREGNF